MAAEVLSDAFRVERSPDDGVARRFPLWRLVLSADGRDVLLYESDRKGLVEEKLHDVVKLLCDPCSEWRERLPKGVDAELGLWLHAKPTREQEREERLAYLRSLFPDGVPGDLARELQVIPVSGTLLQQPAPPWKQRSPLTGASRKGRGRRGRCAPCQGLPQADPPGAV